MTVGELIERLKQFNPDATVRFYDCQWEHASWNITDVETNPLGTVILSDQEFI